MKHLRLVPLAVLAAALSACGGGGGGDEEPPGPQAADVAITAANQDIVTRATAFAIAGGVAGYTSTPVGGNASALDAALQRVRIALAGRERPLALQGPFVQPCAAGGQRTLTFDDRDNNNVESPGDVIDAVDQACRDTPFEETSGRLRITVTAVSGAPLSLSASALFENYSIQSTATAQRRVVFNGDFALTVTDVNANHTRIQIEVGQGLTLQVTHPRYTDTVTLQPRFAVVVNDYISSPNHGGQPMTATEVNGVVRSQAAGGTFLVYTFQSSMEQVGDEAYPRFGTAIAQSQAGGQLRLTARSATTVHVQADINNDAVYDNARDVPWDELI